MELCLQNCGLRMTSENFEEIFQLIKDDTPKENTNLREIIPPRLELAATSGFLSTGGGGGGGYTRVTVMSIVLPTQL